jgi:hypothetical protein
MIAELTDVTGHRGENILELCLTDYKDFPGPLFRPGFLGDKWPCIDFYVELRNVRKTTPYFFVQVKTTGASLRTATRSLAIPTRKKDVEGLLRIPGPTYIFGVHEPSHRVFVKSIHAGCPVKAVTRIPFSHELTSDNLRALHREVQMFWKSNDHKPSSSVFA